MIATSLSYSYADPFPGTGAIGSGYKLVSSLTPPSPCARHQPRHHQLQRPGPGPRHPDLQQRRVEQRLGNSNNHNKDGQNVLFGDGHVEFQNNALVGINRDNIYATNLAAGGFALSTTASPLDNNDSFLLPTDDN